MKGVLEVSRESERGHNFFQSKSVHVLRGLSSDLLRC